MVDSRHKNDNLYQDSRHATQLLQMTSPAWYGRILAVFREFDPDAEGIRNPYLFIVHSFGKGLLKSAQWAELIELIMYHLNGKRKLYETSHGVSRGIFQMISYCFRRVVGDPRVISFHSKDTELFPRKRHFRPLGSVCVMEGEYNFETELHYQRTLQTTRSDQTL